MKFFKTFLLICLIVIAAVTVWAQNGRGIGNSGQRNCAICPLAQSSPVVNSINTAEESYLLYIREEEKLARDIYVELYKRWNIRIFSNIEASEQRHFDAVGALINRYALTDPAQKGAGDFSNSELQDLYDRLLLKGLISPQNALEVGVEIEETDIHDLESAIAATDNEDIRTVYDNLLMGSERHLSAFSRHR